MEIKGKLVLRVCSCSTLSREAAIQTECRDLLKVPHSPALKLLLSAAAVDRS